VKEPRRLRIELVDPLLIRSGIEKLEGVKVSGLRSEPRNGPVDEALVHLTVEVAISLSAHLVSPWLAEYIKQYGAKRVKINHREPLDEADFRRIVVEELGERKKD
jgi:hypothetical protein